MEAIRIGDIEISTALYGEGGDPPPRRDLRELPGDRRRGVDHPGGGRGGGSTGGSVDESSLETSTADGYTYACMAGGGTGFLVPGGPTQEGVVCVFDGELVGIVISTHTTDPVAGLADVRVVHRGVRGGVTGSAVVWPRRATRPAPCPSRGTAVDVHELPGDARGQIQEQERDRAGLKSPVSRVPAERRALGPAASDRVEPRDACRPSSSSARRTRCSPGSASGRDRARGSG